MSWRLVIKINSMHINHIHYVINITSTKPIFNVQAQTLQEESETKV